MIEKGPSIFPLAGQSQNLINNIKNILPPINKEPLTCAQKGLSSGRPIVGLEKKNRDLPMQTLPGEGLNPLCVIISQPERTAGPKLISKSLSGCKLNIQWWSLFQQLIENDCFDSFNVHYRLYLCTFEPHSACKNLSEKQTGIGYSSSWSLTWYESGRAVIWEIVYALKGLAIASIYCHDIFIIFLANYKLAITWLH